MFDFMQAIHSAGKTEGDCNANRADTDCEQLLCVHQFVLNTGMEITL